MNLSSESLGRVLSTGGKSVIIFKLLNLSYNNELKGTAHMICLEEGTGLFYLFYNEKEESYFFLRLPDKVYVKYSDLYFKRTKIG